MTLRRSGTMHATLLAAALSSTPLVAQTSAGSTDFQSTPTGPFARIAILRPHDGDSIDIEAGYIRHLDAHRLAKDTWMVGRLVDMGRRLTTGYARHARRRDPLVPHGRRRTRSALRSTAPASEPFGDPAWTLRAGTPRGRQPDDRSHDDRDSDSATHDVLRSDTGARVACV